MGYRHTREELIEEWFTRDDILSKNFYSLPTSEKSKKEVFEEFCRKRSGTLAIILSDDEICDNKELVLIAAKYGFYTCFELLSERLLKDADVAVALANCNRYEYTKISKEIRDNADVMLQAVKVNPAVFISLPVNVKADRRILMEVAKNMPSELKFLQSARKEIKDSVFSDKDLALIVAETDPDFLINFLDEIKSDIDILNKVFDMDNPVLFKKKLKKYTWGFSYINPDLWTDDVNLVKEAVKIDGTVYTTLPDDLKNNRGVVLNAVKSCPEMIGECPKVYCDDEAIVKASLQEDTEELLSYASDRLKDDYDVVYKAVKVDALNLQYASDRLRDDRDIVLRAIKTYGGVLEDASDRLQKDDELIRIAEKNS